MTQRLFHPTFDNFGGQRFDELSDDEWAKIHGQVHEETVDWLSDMDSREYEDLRELDIKLQVAGGCLAKSILVSMFGEEAADDEDYDDVLSAIYSAVHLGMAAQMSHSSGIFLKKGR